MDVLDFAMQMELDGKAFYEKGAATTDSNELRQVLTTLAEEEAKHYRIFKALKENRTGDAKSAMGGPSGTPVLAKNVFQQLAAAGIDRLYGDEVQALWKEAIEVERKSEQMYREAAEEESDEARRDLLNRIADEEKNHIYLIDNMIQFMRDPAAFTASQQYRDFMSWEGH